ncbi:MAG TPA: CPBP family intramembrane glutamic endopeptidase [Labilithrix sp.]|nr:CPBP family intramembrane glutamic endopeptidase [Labilithrix sp.]
MTDFAWTPAERQTVVMVTMTTFVYLAYHYGLSADRFRARLRARLGPDELEIASVARQRVLGGLLLGLAPALTLGLLGAPPLRHGLGRADWASSLGWVAALTAIVLPILARASRSPRQWATYPQMRITAWNRRRWWQSTLCWGVYLLGYEYFFRGALLFWLVDHVGVWPGIVIMNGLYTFAHLNKDVGETVGSAFMGVVFAAMALHTGAIWAPFALHWIIATASETFAIRANPALRWDGAR